MEKYEDIRGDLIRKHDEKKQQLNNISSTSANAQQAHIPTQETSKMQLELSALEWRIKEAQIDLNPYQKITPANLLNLILKT